MDTVVLDLDYDKGFFIAGRNLFQQFTIQEDSIPYIFLLINTKRMGSRRTTVPPGHKQFAGSRFHVLYPSKHFDHKPSNPPVKKVEQAKLLMGIFSAFGIPAYIAGIFWNIDNIKGWILFTVGFLYAVARLYFYVVRQKQEKKLRDIDIRRQLQEIENEIFPHQ